jgi:hypothetical protein
MVAQMPVSACTPSVGCDLRLGLRHLRPLSSSATTAVFTRALGIGTNPARCELVDGVLQRVLPHGDLRHSVIFWRELGTRLHPRAALRLG